jgi:hypothetical protein
MSRFRQGTGERLQWRVVVRPGSRVDPAKATLPLTWHLVTCTDWFMADAHCDEGQRLLAQVSDPDGHCLVGGACPRCDVDAAVRREP